MPINNVHKRFGGVYFPETNIHGFFGVPTESTLSGYFLIHVDSKKLQRLYNLTVSRRIPYSLEGLKESENRLDVLWRFLNGPRQPIQIPLMSINRTGIVFSGYSTENNTQTPCNVKALLDWEAAAFPVLVNAHVDVLHEFQNRVGVKIDASPAMPLNNYLTPVRDVLLAFEAGKSPADLFQDRLNKDKNNKVFPETVVQAVHDFAILTQLQLNYMLAHHDIRVHHGFTALPRVDGPNFSEARRLLHQREVLAEWLSSQRDMEKLPSWQREDMCSIDIARRFYEESKLDASGTGISQLYVAASNILTDRKEGINISPGKRPDLSIIINPKSADEKPIRSQSIIPIIEPEPSPTAPTSLGWSNPDTPSQPTSEEFESRRAAFKIVERYDRNWCTGEFEVMG